jgi:hypothetical protein
MKADNRLSVFKHPTKKSMKKAFLFSLILLLPLLAGCTKTVQKAVDAGTGIGALEKKQQADKELAKINCIELCQAEFLKGTDLSDGPCLGNPIPGLEDWVCDVAHSPRQAVDNDPANQCSSYRFGQAKHFVEVDESCNFIKVY